MASSVLVEQKYLLPDNYTSVMFQILIVTLHSYGTIASAQNG